jgi:hypothetical protein
MSSTNPGPTLSIGGNASGTLRNPAQGVAGGLYDPAQTLGGAARLPAVNAAGASCMAGE